MNAEEAKKEDPEFQKFLSQRKSQVKDWITNNPNQPLPVVWAQGRWQWLSRKQRRNQTKKQSLLILKKTKLNSSSQETSPDPIAKSSSLEKLKPLKAVVDKVKSWIK